MKTNEEEHDNAATTRAGGDVIVKGPSQRTEDTEGETDTKSNAAAQGSDVGTRAGGDVIVKGPSQKE